MHTILTHRKLGSQSCIPVRQRRGMSEFFCRVEGLPSKESYEMAMTNAVSETNSGSEQT